MPKNLRKPAHDPKIDEYEDALGESGGKRRSQYAPKAKYNTAIQDVRSAGSRTVDWTKRDLLIGGTGDDRRNWPQRKLLKNDASFLVQSYDRLKSSTEIQTTREARAFDYLNRRHQLAMLGSMERDSCDYRAAACASVCPTSLYRTSTLIPHTWSFVRNYNVCMNSWICPHCYARLMVEKFRIASRRLKKHRPAYIALLSEENNIALAEQEYCKSRRASMRESLLSTAQKLGGTGGLWTVQLGPILEQRNYWDVNEAHYDNVEELVLRFSLMAFIPEEHSSLTNLKAFITDANAIPQGTTIDIVPAGGIGALRAVMVKSRNISTASVQLVHNSHGLFYWPTMTLCSPLQWHSRFLMTRYQQSARAWGNWCRGCSRTPSTKSESRTKQRRESLLEATIPILINSGYPDVPIPGRVDLRKLLGESGVEASERDVRWLISEVRQNRISS
jgi:hypothetical protein